MRAEAESLAEALAARKVIERAKGLLMEKERLTEEEAFARLRKASQASGRPLKVIAEAVVATLSGKRDRVGASRTPRSRAASSPLSAGTAMVISAALARDVVWRVPGNTVMSGEYHGRREVVEFLRRTGTETEGTYRSRLETVLADDDWAIAIYRATGRRNGIDLDVDQAFVIRCGDGQWREVTAVPLDSAFERFWA